MPSDTFKFPSFTEANIFVDSGVWKFIKPVVAQGFFEQKPVQIQILRKMCSLGKQFFIIVNLYIYIVVIKQNFNTILIKTKYYNYYILFTIKYKSQVSKRKKINKKS